MQNMWEGICSKLNLEVPQRTHIGNKLYQCSKCYIAFTWQTNLIVYLRNDTAVNIRGLVQQNIFKYWIFVKKMAFAYHEFL